MNDVTLREMMGLISALFRSNGGRLGIIHIASKQRAIDYGYLEERHDFSLRITAAGEQAWHKYCVGVTDSERTPVATNAPTRSFIHFDRAWYAEANRALVIYEWVDDITLDIDDMPGEVHIQWYSLQNDELHSAHLEVYDDSWKLLAAMPDVIALLATLDGQNVQPMPLCTMLVGLGFVDATPPVKPNESEGE